MPGIGGQQILAIPDTWSWRTWPRSHSFRSPRKQRRNRQIYPQRFTGVKTTIPILSPLEHEILNWAINSDLFGEAESNFPTGWNAWDRSRVLESKQLVLDWETPHIAKYVAFILLRLQDLYGDARAKHGETARELEKRIRHALKAQGASGHKLPFRNAPR